MLSVERILTFLFATHTNILTSHKSTEPSSSTSTLWERSPTPYTLRIQPQAASEPTAWLFMEPHILFHLVRHWGP